MAEARTQLGQSDVALYAQQARKASRLLAALPHQLRRALLLAGAEVLERRRAEVLEANRADIHDAEALVATGDMTQSMLARLRTSERGIMEMAEKIREVAQMPDPLGRELATTELDEGLVLHKVSCPLGVIAIIFESRPDAVPQVVSLALKTGNAILLKGGSEAQRTNEVLVSVWHEALAKFPGVPRETVVLLHTRDDVRELLKLGSAIDLIVPRGSNSFVRYIMENSRSPVLGHGEGVCHVYVDGAADVEKAWSIAMDSKVQYPAACNAAETLLVQSGIAEKFLPEMVRRFVAAKVEVRGCPRTHRIVGDSALPATEVDWASEYSDLVIAVRVVENLAEAVEHINRYGSKHTDCIVTEDANAAAQFMQQVDAAGVFHNVSTRFADGYRYGLGSEVGISTGKLHARGPVGLEGLTTYKYKLVGNGHVVADYSSGARKFHHRQLR